MRKKGQYLLLVIFTFLFIYHPPILITHTLHFLAGISWFIIIFWKKKAPHFEIQKHYIKEVLFASIMILYLFTVLLINGKENLLVAYVFLIIVFEIIPISYVILFLLKRIKGLDYFSDLLIHVSFLQSLIAILTFSFPFLQSFVINIMIMYGYNDIIIRLSEHRMYGYTYTFPYSMPIVQGAIGALAIYMAINKNFKYFIFAPFILFSGLINARIAIVIFFIALGLILIHSISLNFKNVTKMLIILSISLLIISPTAKVIEEYSPNTYLWLKDGVTDIQNLFYGDTSGNYASYVTDERNYKLPEGTALIIGTSEKVIRGNSIYTSDVGYINDVWVGGLIYAFAIYSYLLIILFRIRKLLNSQNMNGTLVSIILLSILVFSNIKGTIFGVNEFITLFYLISLFSISSYINSLQVAEKTRS